MMLDQHARSTAELIGLAGSCAGDTYHNGLARSPEGIDSSSEQPHSVSRHHTVMGGLEPRDWSGWRHAVAEAKDDMTGETPKEIPNELTHWARSRLKFIE